MSRKLEPWEISVEHRAEVGRVIEQLSRYYDSEPSGLIERPGRLACAEARLKRTFLWEIAGDLHEYASQIQSWSHYGSPNQQQE